MRRGLAGKGVGCCATIANAADSRCRLDRIKGRSYCLAPGEGHRGSTSMSKSGSVRFLAMLGQGDGGWVSKIKKARCRRRLLCTLYQWCTPTLNFARLSGKGEDQRDMPLLRRARDPSPGARRSASKNRLARERSLGGLCSVTRLHYHCRSPPRAYGPVP